MSSASVPSSAHSAHTPEAALAQVLHFFEHLQPDDVSRLGTLYCADARFKDPFNEVEGVPAIARIFTHMFDTLVEPHFVITQSMQQGAQGFATWEFVFAPTSTPQQRMTIRGATHFVFREEGGKDGSVWRVAIHRDYWDAAEELYEKLPILGSLMRWLKRKLAS